MSRDPDDLPSDCEGDEVRASMRHVQWCDAQLALDEGAGDAGGPQSSTRLSNEWLGTHGWRVQLLRQRALASPETLEIFDPLVAISIDVEGFEAPTAVWRVTLDSDSISRFFLRTASGFTCYSRKIEALPSMAGRMSTPLSPAPKTSCEALPPELQGTAVTADLKRYMEHDFGKGAFDPSLAHYDPFLLEG